MRSPTNSLVIAMAVVSAAGLGAPLLAAIGPITPGDLVVMRIGDGNSAPGSTGTPAALLEFNPNGTLVQTILLDSTANSTTVFGLTSTKTEGILSISPNGQYVTFGGYRVNPGTGGPNGSGANGTVDRVIGRLDTLTGTVDTSTSISGNATTGNFGNDSFRSVVTDNIGTEFWLSGAAGSTANGGVRYVGSGFGGATTATPVYSANSANTRQIEILGGNLFVSSGSATPGRSVFQVGSGVPTAANQTLTSSFSPASSDQYNSFFFADLDSSENWNGTGYDTLYAADTNSSQLEKFSFNGSSWVAEGAFTLTNLIDITGTVSGSSVTLYGTTSTTSTGQIVSFTDTGGSTGSITGMSFSNLTNPVSAGTNFGFRGIVVVPTPEPATALLFAAPAALLLSRRRGKSGRVQSS